MSKKLMTITPGECDAATPLPPANTPEFPSPRRFDGPADDVGGSGCCIGLWIIAFILVMALIGCVLFCIVRKRANDREKEDRQVTMYFPRSVHDENYAVCGGDGVDVERVVKATYFMV